MGFNAKALLETKGDHLVPMTGRLDNGVHPDVERAMSSGDSIDIEKARAFISSKDPKFGMKIVEGTLRKGIDVDKHKPRIAGGSEDVIRLSI
jgi:hypothetical protein